MSGARTLIVAAHAFELDSAAMGLPSKIRQGFPYRIKFRAGGADLAVVGTGQERAKVNLVSALACLAKPNLLLNIGFVGSLTEDQEIGRLVLVEHVQRSGQTKGITIERELLKWAAHVLQRFSPLSGALVTVDQPVTDVKRRRDLARGGANVADMEAYSLGQLALQYELPFLSVKVVSDRADSQTNITLKKHGPEIARLLREAVELLLGNRYQGHSD